MKVMNTLAALSLVAAGVGIGFVLGLNTPAPDFPVTTYPVSAASCAGEEVAKRKCVGIDWKMLNQSLDERKTALSRTFNADVRPMNYDALRQAGLLPK